MNVIFRIAAWLVIIHNVSSLIYNLAVKTSVISIDTATMTMVVVGLLEIGVSIGLLYRQRGAYGVLFTLAILGAFFSFLQISSGRLASFYLCFWITIILLLVIGAEIERARRTRDKDTISCNPQSVENSEIPK